MTDRHAVRSLGSAAGRTVAGSLLLALLLPLLVMFAATPAHAEEEPPADTPEPAACEAVIGESRCLKITYPGAEANPVPGIKYTITLPGGEQEAVETDESGVYVREVTEEGKYGVALVRDSLPEGVHLETGSPEEFTGRLLELNSTNEFTFNFSIRAEDYVAETSTFDYVAQSAASGLRLGLVLALAAVGLSLIYGTTGLSSFSHAEQVTLGGMTCYIFVNWVGLPFLAAAVLTVAFCGFTGYLQDAVMWKPLRRRGLGLIQMMIVTIGLSLALQYTFQVVVGARQVRIISAKPETIEIGPVVLTLQSYIAMGIAIVVLTAVGYALLRTRLGRATRAVSDNPALALASGIDVDRVIRLVWILACALAGLAGIMLALVFNGIKWDSGMQILLLLFAAVTLGGLGTAFGALIGSLVIGMVVELSPVFGIPGDLKYATALLMLILLLMVRPQGLLGKAGRVG